MLPRSSSMLLALLECALPLLLCDDVLGFFPKRKGTFGEPSTQSRKCVSVSKHQPLHQSMCLFLLSFCSLPLIACVEALRADGGTTGFETYTLSFLCFLLTPDECETANDCGENAQCLERYCFCKEGYTGDAKAVCTRIPTGRVAWTTH